jgi:hypothetical protein
MAICIEERTDNLSLVGTSRESEGLEREPRDSAKELGRLTTCRRKGERQGRVDRMFTEF